MRRRDFLVLAAGFGLSARELRADHHILSIEPLIVDFDLGSLRGQYTRVDDFYIRNHFDAPQQTGSYGLRIEGEVGEAQQLNLEQLQRLPLREMGSVLECAGDPVKVTSLVSDGLWRGWHLADVLALTKPKRDAAYVHLFGADGFGRSVPLERAINSGLLVNSLNGRPLTRNHGAPWRALIPGWYGMDSVKWLEKIVLAPAPLPPAGQTYMEVWRASSGGFETKALPPVQVKSLIASPRDGAVVERGKLPIRGVAWSGSGSISRVEVTADSGNRWLSASIRRSISRFDWVVWQASLEANGAGPIELACKATDSSGNTQPPKRDPRRIDSYACNVWDRVRCLIV